LLKTIFNERYYYVINTNGAIVVNSLMVIDIDELFLIKELTQREKKKIEAKLEMTWNITQAGKRL
jgi:hypothetical protein